MFKDLTNIGFYTADKCNWKCDYCICDVLTIKSKAITDFNYIKKTILYFKQLSPHLNFIRIAGYEPTLYLPLIKKLLPFLVKQNLKLSFQTNGSLLLNDQWLQIFKKYGRHLMVGLSIDGDLFTSSIRHHTTPDFTQIRIRCQQYTGTTPKVVLTFTKETLPDLFNNFLYVVEVYGYTELYFNPVFQDNFDDFQSLEFYKKQYLQIFEYARKNNIVVQNFLEIKPEDKLRSLAIDSEGYLYKTLSCLYWADKDPRFIIGRLSSDISNYSEATGYAKIMHDPVCDKCTAKAGCTVYNGDLGLTRDRVSVQGKSFCTINILSNLLLTGVQHEPVVV